MKLEKIIEPNQEIQSLQQEVLAEISKLLPDSEVELVGSMSVPLAGRPEIDVMVISKDVSGDTEIIANNGYKKGPIENQISYLKIHKNGIEVGVQIVPLGHKMIQVHRNILEKLKSDDVLRKSYEDFKKSLDGLPRDEYKQKKSQWIKNHLL